jgi:hypothetical protein
VDFKGVRIGQETSTFGVQQGSAPTTADFDGPPTGVTIRSGMIRYDQEARIGAAAHGLARDTQGGRRLPRVLRAGRPATDQRLPDLAVNASKAGDWGTSPSSALVREIRFRTTTSGVSEAQDRGVRRQPGGWLRLFKYGGEGRCPVLPVRRRRGAGPYLVSLTGQNADALPDPATGELNAVPAYGGYVAYERRWTPQFFSTLIGAGNILKNEVDPTRAIEFKTSMVMFNSFYQPIKTMKIGGEVDWGRKHHADGYRGGGAPLLPRRPLRFLGALHPASLDCRVETWAISFAHLHPTVASVSMTVPDTPLHETPVAGLRYQPRFLGVHPMNDFRKSRALRPADPADADATSFDACTLSRRRWLQLTAGGAVGLALDGVIDVDAVRAATKTSSSPTSPRSPPPATSAPAAAA